jgi:hypothetical protein
MATNRGLSKSLEAEAQRFENNYRGQGALYRQRMEVTARER